jgi:SPP1 family predicted phage head-tail adaptor
MRAGLLRHRVELQSRTLTADGFGQPVETWATYATVSASVSPLRGRERFAAMQVAAETTHRIVMRGRSGIKAEDRVFYDGRVFDIRAIMDMDERGIMLELLCTEEIQ